MRSLLPFITLGVGVLAVRAIAGAQRRQNRVITLPEILIEGRVPPRAGSGTDSGSGTPGVGGARRPLQVRFDVRVSGMEKWVVTPAVVAQAVGANTQAGILPGSGQGTVRVSDNPSGYTVSVSYPDSYSDISAVAAQRAIEGIDSRLEGRISNVLVDRA